MGTVLRKHIDDVIYGANDGIITTFAIVAGAVGASLSARVILILGLAGLVADAFSMGASNYLSGKSEKEVAEMKDQVYDDHLLGSAVLTFLSFIVAGSLPLLPYIFGMEAGFIVAVIATAAALFFIGSMIGALVLHRHWLLWGLEMLLIGGMASAIAYGVGYFASQFTGVILH